MYSLLTLIILLAPFTTYASAFVPLVGLPGIDGEMNFTTYMNALYALSISIAALLAVVKIIIAGVKWMLTDVVTSKGEAKKDIEGALIGLLVVVAAVLILTVINPALTELEPFKQLSEVDTSVRPVAGAVEPLTASPVYPTCPNGQRVSVDTSVFPYVYSCVAGGSVRSVTSDGLVSVTFSYICPGIRGTGNPCRINADYDKSQAIAACDSFNGELTDLESTVGKGVCRYEVINPDPDVTGSQ